MVGLDAANRPTPHVPSHAAGGQFACFSRGARRRSAANHRHRRQPPSAKLAPDIRRPRVSSDDTSPNPEVQQAAQHIRRTVLDLVKSAAQEDLNLSTIITLASLAMALAGGWTTINATITDVDAKVADHDRRIGDMEADGKAGRADTTRVLQDIAEIKTDLRACPQTC